ncbi:MAG: GNAT family N-acetyltransferase [Rhizonema sp. NSF051]|nr:GNAT family N-acetyltransferase [Rhizonema sp. NSF051]
MKILLETERLILRQFTEDDTDNLFELNSDPEVVRFTQDRQIERSVIQTEMLPKIFAYYEKYDGYGVWAAIEKSSQEFIGWFLFRAVEYASYFDPALANKSDIELGYRLRKVFWGKGYATEGSKALIFKGFEDLGTQCVVSVALTANVASIRVMQKAGLKLEKRFIYEAIGQEVVIYVLPKDEFKVKNCITN